MSLFSRRDFLKASVTLLSSVTLLLPLAEALEIKRRKLVEGVAQPGEPEPLPAPESEKDALRLLVVGDWGWYGIKVDPTAPADYDYDNPERGRNELSVARAMGDFAAARRPDFVLSVGDNFYPYGIKSTDDPRWETTFVNAYAAPGLQVPWHVALGNHDYRGSVPAQIAYSEKSARWRMPARHFSFVEKTPAGVIAQFFVLDTCPFVPGLRQGGHSDVAQQDGAAQLAWLDRELAASKADWKILVGHHPIWTGGVRRDMNEQNLHELLPPLMKKHGVKLYLCGHEHDAQHIERDGIHNVLTGHGGDMRPTGTTDGTRFAESRLGFGYLTITRAAIRADFVDSTGEIRHTVKIAADVQAGKVSPT